MEHQLRRCIECYAYVESMTNHQNWHSREKRKLRDLEDRIEKLRRDMP